jgi:inosose dehydratase
MEVTRRQLLAGLATAGAASVCSPLLQKAGAELAGPARLYPPIDLSIFDTPVDRGAWKLRVGYAAITWGNDIDQAVEQIAAVGYPGVQLLGNVLKVHPDPESVKALLAQHKLIFVALSSGGTQLDPAKEKEVLDEHAQHAKYLHAAGGKYLQVIGAGDPKGTSPNWTAADYKRQGYLLTEIGKRAADLGIQTGFHNHMNTIGQAPQATDAIMDAADPRYVKLELDVAHYLQGGGDPAAAVRKYKGRLLYMHLKDTKPSPDTRSGYQFAELGQGRVDFKALLAALEETRFRGWGVVELDGERPGSTRTPQESARMSKQYLESLGVQV